MRVTTLQLFGLLNAVHALLVGPSAGLRHAHCSAPRHAHCSASATPEETALVQKVTDICSSLTRFGLDNGDKAKRMELTAAVYALYDEMPVDPPIANDGRLIGDWKLIGGTSLGLLARKGLTGLGAAPFTNLGALHWSFTAEGRVTCRETLEFFGKPVILNEVRGRFSFSDEGDDMLDTYEEGDLGGQQNSPAFTGADFTLLESAITSCGQLRLGRDDDEGVYVFLKLGEGGLNEYLDEVMLPTAGGTYLGNPTWKGPVERA